jgi:phospholipid transport system substrate-binding protein
MKKLSLKLAKTLLLVSLLCVSSVALAAGTAQEFLQSKQGELSKIIAQPKSAANDRKLQQVFDGMLDYNALASASLGSAWKDLSSKEQEEFSGLLQILVQRSYTKNIRNTLNYKVTYSGEEKASKGQLVKTIARHATDKRKEPLHIDYLTHQISGAWKVIDIVTEGSSLVKNYRSQFRRIMRKEGFEGLSKKMKAKVAEDSN